MRLLTRYVSREIGIVFAISLSALTSLIVLVLAGQEAINKGLGLAQFLQLIPFILPNALVFSVPGTILFSVATVYGRMSGSNEIVALKAQGLSPMIVIWPALILSLVLSVTCVWMNDISTSWGARGARQLILDSLEDIAYGMLRSHRSFSDASFTVTVKRVDGHQLIEPTFFFQENGELTTIRAESAELRSLPGEGKLVVSLVKPVGDSQGQHFQYNDRFEYEIDLESGEGKPSPAKMPMRDITANLPVQVELIRSIEDRMAQRSGFELMTGDFDALVGPNWSRDEQQLKGARNQLNKLRTEPPRRWANGFSCACFALVGAAMAIRMKNADVLTSFFLCFGPILVVYYPLLMFGVNRAKGGSISPQIVWLANVVIVLWGLWLLRRVLRY